MRKGWTIGRRSKQESRTNSNRRATEGRKEQNDTTNSTDTSTSRPPFFLLLFFQAVFVWHNAIFYNTFTADADAARLAMDPAPVSSCPTHFEERPGLSYPLLPLTLLHKVLCFWYNGDRRCA